MLSGHHHRSMQRVTLVKLGLGGGAIAAAVIAVAVGIGQVTSSQACAAVLSAAGTTSGIATHYVLQSGGGNCSYPGPPADQLYVALSPGEYDSAAPCGSYLEVHGPDGSVRVEVADQCPECATGHIDLSATAFAKIAPLSAGLVNVSYQTIADPSLPGPLAFVVKNGSSRYWLSLVVMNTGNALTSVQVETVSGGWLNLSRANYNAWNSQSGAGPGPFTVRLTDTLGNQVTVRNIALNPGAVQGTGTYMYGAGSAPPAPATPTSAPATSPPATSASPTSARTLASSPAARPRHTHKPAKPKPTVARSLAAQLATLPPVAQALLPRPASTPGC
jgi:expansin (peptidoglycan-binding protein)